MVMEVRVRHHVSSSFESVLVFTSRFDSEIVYVFTPRTAH
jgi:hypothetical protein